MTITKQLKWTIIVSILLAFFLIPGIAFADDDEAIFSSNDVLEVVSQESWPVMEGVTEYKVDLKYVKDYTYGTSVVKKGDPITVYALKIDHDSKTLLVPSFGGYYRSGSTAATRARLVARWSSVWGGKLDVISNQVAAYESIADPKGEVVAAFNGDFTNGDRPNGRLTIEGNVISESTTSNGAIGISDNGIYKFTGAPSSVAGMPNVMGTWGAMFSNGTNSDISPLVNEKDLESRSTIALKDNGDIVYASFPMNTQGTSVGIGLYYLADFLMDSGYKEGHNLQGGRGSSLLTKRAGEDSVTVKSQLLYPADDGAGNPVYDDEGNQVFVERPVGSALLLIKTECARGNEHNYVYNEEGKVVCDRCGDEAPEGTVPDPSAGLYDNADANESYAVSTDREFYNQGDEIKVKFKSPLNDASAWIAIYPKGASAHQNVAWQYVTDVTNDFDITGGRDLPAGEYVVAILPNGGYKTKASVYVTVEKDGYSLSTDKDSYEVGQPIMVTAQVPDNKNCWVGVYTLGQDSNALAYYYLQDEGVTSPYDLTKKIALEEGTYKLTLSTEHDDENNSTASAVKIIKVTPEGQIAELATANAVGVGEPIMVTATSNMNGAWVGIYEGKMDDSFDYADGGKRSLYYYYVADHNGEAFDISQGISQVAEDYTFPAGDYTVVLFHSESGDDYIVDKYVNVKVGTLINVRFNGSKFEYNGTVQKPTVSVKEGENDLVQGTDYIIEWSDENSKNAGEYTVKVTMLGEYATEGPYNFSYVINIKDINESATVEASAKSFEYNGKVQRPTITAKDGDIVLKEGTDYDITWSEPESKNVGKGYKATVDFKGNYSGSRSFEYKITAADITSTASMELSATEFTYNGNVQRPDVVVKNGDTVLEYDVDYELEYSDKMSSGSGEYTITANFKGNYTGDVTASYKITSKAAGKLEITVDQTYFNEDGTLQHPNIIIRDGNHRLVQEKDFNIEIPDSIKGGKYTLVINYIGEYSGSDSVEYVILGKTPTNTEAKNAKVSKEVAQVKGFSTSISVSKKTIGVKFNAVKGADNYRVAYRLASSKTWKYKWTDGKTKFDLTGLKANGIYQVKVVAFKNNLGTWVRGKYSVTNYRFIANTSLKVTGDKRSVTAKVKKVAKGTGYEIFYSLKSNMANQKKTVIAKAATTSKVIKNLKAKKTYYLKARPVKKYKGKTYTGAMDIKAKKVKTK